MKVAFAIIGGVAAILLALALWERWDEQKNRGHTWGYWGEFNTVSNRLANLPSVVKAWHNNDFLVLEEFGFDIMAQGQPVALVFGEKDPIRKLSAQKLDRALLEMISNKKSSNHSMQRMRASRSAKLAFSGQWRLAPTADAHRSP